jgi:hypothetical protein
MMKNLPMSHWMALWTKTIDYRHFSRSLCKHADITEQTRYIPRTLPRPLAYFVSYTSADHYTHLRRENHSRS